MKAFIKEDCKDMETDMKFVELYNSVVGLPEWDRWAVLEDYIEELGSPFLYDQFMVHTLSVFPIVNRVTGSPSVMLGIRDLRNYNFRFEALSILEAQEIATAESNGTFQKETVIGRDHSILDIMLIKCVWEELGYEVRLSSVSVLGSYVEGSVLTNKAKWNKARGYENGVSGAITAYV